MFLLEWLIYQIVTLNILLIYLQIIDYINIYKLFRRYETDFLLSRFLVSMVEHWLCEGGDNTRLMSFQSFSIIT